MESDKVGRNISKFHQMLLVVGVLIIAINVGAATAKCVQKRVFGNSDEPFASYDQKVCFFAIQRLYFYYSKHILVLKSFPSLPISFLFRKYYVVNLN